MEEARKREKKGRREEARGRDGMGGVTFFINILFKQSYYLY